MKYVGGFPDGVNAEEPGDVNFGSEWDVHAL